MTRRSRLRTVGVPLFAIASAAASLFVGAPSAAAHPADLSWQSQCQDYRDFIIWTTSTQWARVSHRSCVEWTTNSNLVRALAEFRVDYPDIFHCSVTLPGGLSCAATKAKAPIIQFKYVNTNLYWSLSGQRGSASCHGWVNHVSSRVGLGAKSTDVLQCRSSAYYIPRGQSTHAVASDVAADVADDGQGERILPRTADQLTGLNNQ